MNVSRIIVLLFGVALGVILSAVGVTTGNLKIASEPVFAQGRTVGPLAQTGTRVRPLSHQVLVRFLSFPKDDKEAQQQILNMITETGKQYDILSVGSTTSQITVGGLVYTYTNSIIFVVDPKD